MRTGTTKMNDPFFTKRTCDRCPNDLAVRIMSWFNKDVICMECHDKEEIIKKALRAKGIDDAMEGCGYIPDPTQELTTECVRT